MLDEVDAAVGIVAYAGGPPLAGPARP